MRTKLLLTFFCLLPCFLNSVSPSASVLCCTVSCTPPHPVSVWRSYDKSYQRCDPLIINIIPLIRAVFTHSDLDVSMVPSCKLCMKSRTSGGASSIVGLVVCIFRIWHEKSTDAMLGVLDNQSAHAAKLMHMSVTTGTLVHPICIITAYRAF